MSEFNEKRNKEKRCIAFEQNIKCENFISEEIGCKYLCKHHIKLFMINGWPGSLYLPETNLRNGQVIHEMCIDPVALSVDSQKWIQYGIQLIPYEIAVSQQIGPAKWKEIIKSPIISDFCVSNGNGGSGIGECVEIMAYNGVYNYSQLGEFDKKNAHRQQILKIPIDVWNAIIKTFPKTVWVYEGNNKSRRKFFPPIFSIKYLLKMMRYFKNDLLDWTDININEWKKFQVGLMYLECQDDNLINLVNHHIQRLSGDLVIIQTKDGKRHFFSKSENIISGSFWIQDFLKKRFYDEHNDQCPTISVVFDSHHLSYLLQKINGTIDKQITTLSPFNIINELIYEGLKFDEHDNSGAHNDKDLNVLHHILEYLINKRCNLKYLLGQFWIGTIDITDITHPDSTVEYLENIRNILHKRKDMHIYITMFESVFPRFIRSVDMIPLYKDQKRYTRCKGLGSGTYGSVSSYYDNITREFVALKKQKIVNKTNPNETTDLKHILREINILLHLSPHLNILHMENFFRDSDNIYIVTPYHKQTLTKLIHETKKFKSYLNLNKIKTIISQILHGLKWMHHKGVIHADLKPDNIMDNNKTGNMEIIDFGSAKNYNSNLPYKFKHGTDIVTATYRAPELFPNSAFYDCTLTPSADMWAVGVILLQLLTPFFDQHDDSPFSITYNRRKKYFQHVNEKEPSTLDTDAWNSIYNIIVENAISDFVDKENYTISPHKILAHIKKYSHLKEIPDDLFDLLISLLTLNPLIRISAEIALQHSSLKDVSVLHPYIDKSMNIIPEPLIMFGGENLNRRSKNRKSKIRTTSKSKIDKRSSGVPPDGGPSFVPLSNIDMSNTSNNRISDIGFMKTKTEKSTRKSKKKKQNDEIKIQFHN